MNDTLQKIISYYETNSDLEHSEKLLPMLREIQETEGYIPEQIQKQIADRFCFKPTYIKAVIKRYPSLKNQPSRFNIRICTDCRCSSKQSPAVLNQLESLLQIKSGQTTKDGMFSLQTCLCMHKCAKGPNMTINGDEYSGLTKEQLPDIIKKYQNS